MAWRPSPSASSSSSRPVTKQCTARIKPEDEETAQLFSIPPTPMSMATSSAASGDLDSLVPEQKEALRLMLSGVNVFLTGSAGSGKSFLLISAIARLRDMGKRVRVCAPTGMAAYGVGGATIHSLLGLDPKKMELSIVELEKLASEPAVQERLATTDVLIIDEISMVSAIFFDRLNRMIQVAKEGDKDSEADDDKPFGGIQIIMCGDFRQLPPVKPCEHCFTCGGTAQKKFKNKTPVWRCPRCGREEEESKQWAFFASAWKYCKFKNIKLEKNHRQNEGPFMKFLDRYGNGGAVTQADRTMLYERRRGAGAVVLAAKRDEVRERNELAFNNLRGRLVTYRCLDDFFMRFGHENFRDYDQFSSDGWTLRALGSHMYDTVVRLKLGMRVILIMNLDVENGLCNGSQGTIVAFEPYNEANMPRGRQDNGQPEDLSNTAPEQTASHSNVQLRGGANHSYGLEQMKDFLTNTNPQALLPVVKFDHGPRKTIYPDCSVTQLGDEQPYSLLSVTQIPLIQGNAMTIHKAQGMTMNKVNVDLTSVFAQGQAYVALSRVTSLEGLQMEGSPMGLDKCGPNLQVRNFMRATNWHQA